MIQESGLIALEKHIAAWQEAGKPKQSVTVFFNGKETHVVLLKGYDVYFSATATVIEDSINLAADAAIQQLVQDYFPLAGTKEDKKERRYHCIVPNPTERFVLNFFPSLKAMEEDIASTHESHKHFKEPMPCILL